MENTHPHPKRQRAVIALTLLTCMWGTTFSVVQHALRDVSPLFFAAIRLTVALAIFLIFFPIARTSIRILFFPRTDAEKKLRNNAIILGTSLGIGYMLQFAGLLTTSTSKSAFLTATTVLWTPIFSHFIGHEKLGLRKLLPIGAAILGIVLLTHPYPVESIVIGDIFSALCAVSFGVTILWLNITSPLSEAVTENETDAAILMATIQLAVALIVILISMPIIEHPRLTLTTNVTLSVAYTAIIATTLSAFVQAYYQKELTPTSATLIYTLEPVATALIGFMFLNEHMNAAEFTGSGLIIAAMIVGQ